MKYKKIIFCILIVWTCILFTGCNKDMELEQENEENSQDASSLERNENTIDAEETDNIGLSESDTYNEKEKAENSVDEGESDSDTILILPDHEENGNPYFFSEGVNKVSYHGFFNPLNFRSFWQDIDLNISVLQEYEDGVLYTLTLNQLDLTGVQDVTEWDYITSGRRYLGYYYVTDDMIYMIPVQDIENGYTDECNQMILDYIEEDKEDFFEQYALVCCENGIEDIVDEQGYHCYVETDGNQRIYRYYNDYYYGTKYYQKIVWEKGKGIVYYVCGEGNKKMHVEIWIEGYDIADVPCSPGMSDW